MPKNATEAARLCWRELPAEISDGLTGRLVGLFGSSSDAEAFDRLGVDKQQALLLIYSRMRAKQLWRVVIKVQNVYGEGGVGIDFSAWPFIKSTLRRRKDFTRFLARHKDTSGGFYEKGRAEGVLHFLYQEGTPWKWYVHFDLYSPVFSLAYALKHFRYEYLGKLQPDWRMIEKSLKA